MGVLRSVFLTLGYWTYVIVAVELFLESSAFLGIVLPGDTVVILMGVVVGGTNALSLSIAVPVIIVSVFAGDTSGYLLGRYKGEAVLGYSKHAKHEYENNHDRIVQLQKRWGMWIVVLGRFLPFIRAVTPFAMGIGGLSLKRFLPAAIIAALAWGGGFFVLGYEFGTHWKVLEKYLTPVGGVVFAVVVIWIVVWYWRHHPEQVKKVKGWFSKTAH